ncbi:MAG: PAS domain S-box protein [Pelotomaculum sp.]|nr:PAS domain S-box protein [Pelotomaculum sp.]
MGLEKETQRKSELYEYLTTTHMLCIFILILDMILSKNVFKSIYPAINFRLFVLTNLIGFGVVFLYNTKNQLDRQNPKLHTCIDMAYVTLPLFMAIINFYIFKTSLYYAKTILFLPVLIASSVKGKDTGLTMSTVCAAILVFYKVAGERRPFLQALESELVFISMLYVVGWFTGGLTDIESQHRKQLNANLQDLREEVARREQAEEQLRKLSSALEQSPSIVVIADTGGRIEYVNQKYTQVTGYLPEETIGGNLFAAHECQHPEIHALWSAVNSGREWRGELLSQKKNGEFYWEYALISPFRNSDGVITHLLKVAEDVTARKQMEKEMARLEQLNLIGEMAAGIGHEIRNPMTTVRGFLQLLCGKKEFSKYREYFSLMIDELDRANSIITEYLSMAKNKPVDKKMQSLNQLLSTMAPLIEADAIKNDNYIKMELSDIPDLLLDEKEIRQLVLNLVRNGLEAMPPGQNLIIKTYMEDNEVILSVKDQGHGIEPGVLEKIGTPFFTTKDNGTGLGLAVCYSIAARHNASIKVETSPKGTTFYIKFKVPA